MYLDMLRSMVNNMGMRPCFFHSGWVLSVCLSQALLDRWNTRLDGSCAPENRAR